MEGVLPWPQRVDNVEEESMTSVRANFVLCVYGGNV